MKNKLKKIQQRYKNHTLRIIKKDKQFVLQIIGHTQFLPKSASLQERCYCLLNDVTQRPKCEVCNNYALYNTMSKGYHKTCSAACGHKYSITSYRRTCKKRYGVDNVNKLVSVQDKKKAVFVKKYGVDNPSKCEAVRKKVKQTCIKKYGVSTNLISKEQKEKNRINSLAKYNTEYPTQSEYVKNKTKQTCLKKYGVPYVQQHEPIRQAAKQSCILKYGEDNFFKTDKFKKNKKLQQRDRFFTNTLQELECEPMFSTTDYVDVKQQYKWRCKKCGHAFYSGINNGHRPICPVCFPKQRSLSQQQIFKYITSIAPNTQIVQNDRITIPPLELDLYIVNKRVAVEFNGNYWHSDSKEYINRNYHLNKTNLCENNNIHLIHIFEDEWINKKQIVKSRLKHILGKVPYKLYARKCKIKEIDNKLKDIFLNKYHIQGADKSSVRLGAFYKNRLVAVMTFGKRKITGSKELIWELMRFCTISQFNCVGVASKLLKYFENCYNPKQLLSYADKRWSRGNLYYKLNFNLKHVSAPNYWYMHKANYLYRYHRSNFQKHLLKDKLEKFNPQLTEWENMQNNGYDRIWDCGNLVFTKNYSSHKTV